VWEVEKNSEKCKVYLLKDLQKWKGVCVCVYMMGKRLLTREAVDLGQEVLPVVAGSVPVVAGSAGSLPLVAVLAFFEVVAMV